MRRLLAVEEDVQDATVMLHRVVGRRRSLGGAGWGAIAGERSGCGACGGIFSFQEVSSNDQRLSQLEIVLDSSKGVFGSMN